MHDPKDLVSAQAGDREAAGRVLAAHRGLIVRWCERMLLAGFDLDDMIQEAHIAGLDAIRYFRAETGYQFNTYLKRAVLNRLGSYRKLQRNMPLPQEGGGDDAPDMDLIPDVEAVDPDWLADAMTSLSPLERTALELKHGLSGGESLAVGSVAKRLGIGPESATWLLFSAGEKIRSAKMG